jgi:hypothetical protein
MELQEVLTMAIGTLVTVVIAHFAVYWVVKTLYPPSPKAPVVAMAAPMPVAVPMVVAPPQQAYSPPAVIEQHVELPTYATPVSVEAPREERKGPPPPEDTSIRRKPGVDGADTGA